MLGTQDGGWGATVGIMHLCTQQLWLFCGGVLSWLCCVMVVVMLLCDGRVVMCHGCFIIVSWSCCGVLVMLWSCA